MQEIALHPEAIDPAVSVDKVAVPEVDAQEVRIARRGETLRRRFAHRTQRWVTVPRRQSEIVRRGIPVSRSIWQSFKPLATSEAT
jgi:hypothetical protein